MPPKLTDMSTWTEKTGRASLKSFTDDQGHFWLEQNAAKRSKWAKLARDGHDVAWEFAKEGGYSGRMLIDKKILSTSEATMKFLQKADKT